MGFKCLLDLINILYITTFLKGNSQMLSGLVGCCYTLKIEFIHTLNDLSIWCSLCSTIMHDWSGDSFPSRSVSLLVGQTGFVCSWYSLMRIIRELVREGPDHRGNDEEWISWHSILMYIVYAFFKRI